MNIIDLLIVVILGLSLLAGMHKGFLASALAFCGIVGSWFGAQKLFHILSDQLLGNSTLMGFLSTYLEPANFFEGISSTVAGVTSQTTVTDLLSRGTDAVNGVADFIGSKIPFIRDAFASNMNSEAFAGLNITTITEYFDQTLWQAVFNVLSFIIVFFVLYFVATLVVNLINHVFRFPIIKKVDWLVGGVFGILRGLIVSALLLAILEPALSAFSQELMTKMRDGSRFYTLLAENNFLDFINVKSWVDNLILSKF